MATKNDGGVSTPEKTKMDLVKEAQIETQEQINEKRFETITAMMDHGSIGGNDNVKESLKALLGRFEEGIPYPYLQTVFPEPALMKAREEWKKEGVIEQVGKKGKIILRIAQPK